MRQAIDAPETAEALAVLRRGVARAQGFTLFVAVCNAPAQRDALIERLVADLRPVAATVVRLPAGATDPLDAVATELPAEPGVVMLTNLEQSVPSGNADEHPVLASLNLRRAEWPSRVSQPVVLWIPEYLIGYLARGAPDFWDWRSDLVTFREATTIASMDVDGAARPPGETSTVFVTAEDRRRRIEELERRLQADNRLQSRVGANTGRWLYEVGGHRMALGELKPAEQSFEEALKLAQEGRDETGRAAALHALGVIEQLRGDYDAAEVRYRESLEISVKLRYRAGVAATHHQLGMVAQERGDYEGALEQYRESLAIEEELGDRARMASSFHELGNVAYLRGDHEGALEQYRKSLAIEEELGNRAGIAKSYHQLGMVAQERGDYEGALRQYGRSLAIKEELGDRVGVAATYHQLGMVAQECGDYEGALEQYRKSLAIKEELGDRAGVGSSYHQLGNVAYLRGDYEGALELYRRSLGIFEDLGDRAGMASSVGQLGRLSLQVRRPEEALRWTVRALALFAELESPKALHALRDLQQLREQLDDERVRSELAEVMGEENARVVLELFDRVSED